MEGRFNGGFFVTSLGGLYLEGLIFGILRCIRLQATIADLENKLDKQAAEYSQSTVARDLELEALRQQEEKMRLETVQIKEATDRLILCF